MLKYALLGAAMAMTAPALAQTATSPAAADAAAQQAAPASTDAAPATTAPATSAAPASPAQAAPADQAAQAPAGPAQVAQVVDQQFGAYDKDGDGKLDEAEFGAWMVALKTQTDPATDANSPKTKSWNKAAFAQADKDKSKSLTKAEMTGFLTPAKS